MDFKIITLYIEEISIFLKNLLKIKDKKEFKEYLIKKHKDNYEFLLKHEIIDSGNHSFQIFFCVKRLNKNIRKYFEEININLDVKFNNVNENGFILIFENIKDENMEDILMNKVSIEKIETHIDVSSLNDIGFIRNKSFKGDNVIEAFEVTVDFK